MINGLNINPSNKQKHNLQSVFMLTSPTRYESDKGFQTSSSNQILAKILAKFSLNITKMLLNLNQI